MDSSRSLKYCNRSIPALMHLICESVWADAEDTRTHTHAVVKWEHKTLCAPGPPSQSERADAYAVCQSCRRFLQNAVLTPAFVDV